MKCRNCGLQFLSPIPPKENLYKIYEKDYFKAWGVKENNKSLKKLKGLLYEAIFKEVEKFTIPGCSLDIGCAFGHSFETAMSRRWEPYGIEISLEAYKIAAAKFPGRVRWGDFCNIDLAENRFDLIMMLDFLEHAYNLTEVMLKAHKVLKLNGLVAIVVPNTYSFSSRLMGKSWVHIKLEHIYYLSAKALKILFVKTGFRPVLFKSFWKPINLLYLKSQIENYGPRYQFSILKLLERSVPDYIKQFNIYIPQGEILALAKKV